MVGRECYRRRSRRGDLFAPLPHLPHGNLGTNKDEVFKGSFDIYRPNPSDDLEFSVTIPFDKPFLYVGTASLVVDLMSTGQGYEQWPGCGSGGNGTAMDASRDTGLYSMYGKGTRGTGPTSGTPGAGGFERREALPDDVWAVGLERSRSRYPGLFRRTPPRLSHVHDPDQRGWGGRSCCAGRSSSTSWPALAADEGACSADPAQIRRYLVHLGLPTEASACAPPRGVEQRLEFG